MNRKTIDELLDELLDAFDPNSQGQPWATYCPYRGPAFMTHKERGPALNSLLHFNGILYKWDSKWVEVARRGTADGQIKECEECGTSVSHWQRLTWTDKKTDAPRLRKLCDNCSRVGRKT